jgi:hypothetical protein
MLKKTALSITVLFAFFALLAGIAFAWPDYCKGQPSSYHPGQCYGYYIWCDSHWHLRTSTQKEMHVFEGTISSDREIWIKHRGNMEPDNGDFVTRTAPNQLTFRLTTEGDEDAFGFSTDGSYLIFDLRRDGMQVWTKHIYMGGGNYNPPVNPFVLNR